MASRNFSRRVDKASLERRIRRVYERYNHRSFYGTSEAAIRECFRAKNDARVVAVKNSDLYQELLKDLEDINKQYEPYKLFDGTNTTSYERVTGVALGYASIMSRLLKIIHFTVEPSCGRSIAVIEKVNKTLDDKYGLQIKQLVANPPEDVLVEVITQYTFAMYKSYGYLEEHYKDLVPRCIKDFINKFMQEHI